MGLFDVTIKRKVKKADKKEIFGYFENALKDFSNQTVVTTKENLTLEKFKVKNSLLKYNFKLSIDTSEVLLEGELQDVWIIVIFIALGILFTPYGVGLVVVIAFVYYQKTVATRYLNTIIDTFEQKES